MKPSKFDQYIHKEIITELKCEGYKIAITMQRTHLLYGRSQIGKTSTCLKISHEAILKKKKVYYYDSEMKLFEIEPENVIRNRIKQYVKEYEEYFEYYAGDRANNPKRIIDEIKQLKDAVVIIDSISALFKHPDNIRDHTQQTVRHMAAFFTHLKYYAKTQNLSIIVVTTVRVEKKGERGRPDTLKPVGGHQMLHAADTIIHLTNDNCRDNYIMFKTHTLQIPYKLLQGRLNELKKAIGWNKIKDNK